ncbi:hypothetical protein ACTVH1_16935 [Gluconobacter cerinus]
MKTRTGCGAVSITDKEAIMAVERKRLESFDFKLIHGLTLGGFNGASVPVFINWTPSTQMARFYNDGSTLKVDKEEFRSKVMLAMGFTQIHTILKRMADRAEREPRPPGRVFMTPCEAELLKIYARNAETPMSFRETVMELFSAYDATWTNQDLTVSEADFDRMANAALLPPEYRFERADTPVPVSGGMNSAT